MAGGEAVVFSYHPMTRAELAGSGPGLGRRGRRAQSTPGWSARRRGATDLRLAGTSVANPQRAAAPAYNERPMCTLARSYYGTNVPARGDALPGSLNPVPANMDAGRPRLQPSGSIPLTEEPKGDWFDRLVTSGALYGVDLDQRVTRWSDSAERLLGPARQHLNRRCYEVTAALDPRNAGRCKPNCAVIAAARQGRAHPDFDVFLPPCAGGERARISILVVSEEGVPRHAEPLVLHLVQPTDAERCAHEGPGQVRSMLHAATDGIDAAMARSELQEATALTPRQRAVLVRLAAGESPREIARTLGVHDVTVRNHIQSAMERLGAHSRLEAVLTATNAGLL